MSQIMSSGLSGAFMKIKTNLCSGLHTVNVCIYVNVYANYNLESSFLII